MQIDLVALDLETTGLSIEEDAIIEIGAVRFLNGKIVSEFSQLINPGFAIPAETTYITGITQEDLRNAPTLKDIIPSLSEFIGDCPIIAHNAAFDIGFLRRFGMATHNQAIDTIELASILLPKTPSYALNNLASYFEIPQEQAHRALDDAKVASKLYWKLWERAINLPSTLLIEIASQGQQINWGLTNFFLSAAQNSTNPNGAFRSFPVYRDVQDGLESKQQLDVLDLEEIEGFFANGGALAKDNPSFEQRDEQIHYARSVAESFNQGEHLLIEAGTGTGKSLGYLVPSIQWAIQNLQRVVVATNTINLQEQLIKKDIPKLHDLFEQPFLATIMKGKNNYLCPHRLGIVRRRNPNNEDEVRTLAKILVWLQENSSGDKSEISLRGPEHAIWARMSAEDDGCIDQKCENMMAGTCPFYKARRSAQNAHIIVANHALLISDAVSENRVLPEYRHVIVDEAHQLEEALTSNLTSRIEQTSILRRLAELGGLTSGLLGDILKSVQGNITDKKYMRLEAFIQNIGDAVRELSVLVRGFFNQVNQWIQEVNPQHAPNTTHITHVQREHATFAKLETYGKAVCEYLDVLTNALSDLNTFLLPISEAKIPNFDDYITSARSLGQYFAETLELVSQFVLDPLSNQIYWVETYQNPEYTNLFLAPLHVGTMMKQYLWDVKDTVVLTSATLDINGNFDFVQDRLSANNVKTIQIGSPFNYKTSTLLYIPTDIPEPNRPGYQQAVERGIIELATALDGRMLVLFTSYAQLRETVTNVAPRLALGNITVYDQNIGGNREAMVDNFRSTKKAVIFGTKSFWQGVDIAGDDLLGLIIVKLPFPVPNEPIFASRSETYQNPFNDFAVPEAILRFKQGFGRLIRSKTDKGIVSIFDSRIISKKYGLQFLESLPDCTVKNGALNGLAVSAKNWLVDRIEK
jgi:ATP-dependent DNA helicase DinG